MRPDLIILFEPLIDDGVTYARPLPEGNRSRYEWRSGLLSRVTRALEVALAFKDSHLAVSIIRI